ncbi:FecR family protein [uncultured Rubinisphaera sp.]|uniref:FecR family protein n=1 Tax=uncultured Rubinisphaera sp. TaxID=1678686 RepID=UPI0030D83C38
MSRLKQPEEWSILLNAMVEETLSNEQEARFAELLQNDSEFRRQYVLFCQIHTQLSWHLSFKSTSILPFNDNSVRVNPVPQRRTSWTIGFVAVSVFSMILSWLVWQSLIDVETTQIVSVSGRVGIIRGKHDKMWLLPGDIVHNPLLLQPGDRIQTDRFSSARLMLSDRTELRLRSESEMIIPPNSISEINILRGSLYAKVTPQRSGHELIFHTSNSQVRVIGTELEVLSLAEQSQVAVSEGKVEVLRDSDRSSSTVSAGQFLPVTESSPLTVITWPQPRSEWSVDFEQGLPRGWTGRFVKEESAITAVSVSQDRPQSFQISSHLEETGLFAWHDDTVIRVTCKSEPPGWFHIYLYARTYSNSEPQLTFCYANPILWESSIGQWRTISIPLSEFRLQSENAKPESLGRIPMQIVFRGESDSKILLIDHIGVERSDQSTVIESHENDNRKNTR